MQNATSVVGTSKLSINAATIYYKVQRSTLRAYFVKNKQSESKLGRKTTLTTTGERDIQEN